MKKTNQIKKFLIVGIVFVLAAVVVYGSDIIAKAGDFYVDGNVGIGTTTPGSIFEIKADNPVLTIRDGGTDKVGKILFKEGATDVMSIKYYDTQNELRIIDEPTSANLMTIERTGNVGIGTTAPSFKFHLQDGVLFVRNDSAAADIRLLATSESSISIGKVLAGGGDDLVLGAHKTEHIRVKQDGKVGIGTKTPGVPLEIKHTSASMFILRHATAGHTVFSQMNAGDFQISRDGTGGADISLQSDGDLIIGQQGDVGIGTANPSHKLNVVGDVNITGDVLMGWERVTASDSNEATKFVDCSAGKKLLGGGCTCTTADVALRYNYPLDDDTWFCSYFSACAEITAYALCARIDS